MQTTVLAALASSIISAQSGRPKLDQRDLELAYAGPRQGLKDAARLAVAIGGVVAYAGLLAFASN